MAKENTIILFKSKNMRYILIIILFGVSVTIQAQEERKIIRQGNKAYEAEKYTESEELYRKALAKKPKSLEADYNIGNALYKQKKFLDAANKYSSLTNSTTDKKELAYIYHNLGNSYLKALKLNESIEAYKKALINNPTDKETKLNLAYAQRMLAQEQKDNKNDDQKNVEPSEYAKKIKKQADELVTQRLYSQAYKLMQDLLAKDKTASAFSDYTKRLKDVVEVNSI